jgi:hypothetical protein
MDLKFTSLREKQLLRFTRNSSTNTTATQTSETDTNMIITSPLSVVRNVSVNGYYILLKLN